MHTTEKMIKKAHLALINNPLEYSHLGDKLRCLSAIRLGLRPTQNEKDGRWTVGVERRQYSGCSSHA